jgi:hypothetical protein
MGFEEPFHAPEQASTPAEIEDRRRPRRNDHVSPPLIPLLRNPVAPLEADWALVIDATFDLALEAMTFWTGIAETIWGVRRQTKAD